MARGWIMWLPPLQLLFLSLMAPLIANQILNYQSLVNRFITNYNKKLLSGNLFRLLVLNLQPETNNDPATPRPLTFTMMETVCPITKPHRNLDECNFKQNGLVKQCSGTISLDATQPSLNISCDGTKELKSNGFLRRIAWGFTNLIYQKYKLLRNVFRKLRNTSSGGRDNKK